MSAFVNVFHTVTGPSKGIKAAFTNSGSILFLGYEYPGSFVRYILHPQYGWYGNHFSNRVAKCNGDIILLPSGPGSPAIIQVTVDNTDLIAISVGTVVNLTNGTGGTMTLQIDDFYPASSFSPVVGLNNVSIGGTLIVGDRTSNPSGSYSGSFEITFNQQ